MEWMTARRPIATAVALIAACVFALPAITVVPTGGHVSSPPAPRVATQPVQLTDQSLDFIWKIATGGESDFPLPAGASPIAPIGEEVARSLLTYGRQLLTGQGNLVPGEISAQVARVRKVASAVSAVLAADVGVVALSVFSAAFLSALIVESKPAPSTAFAAVSGIWLNALEYPVLTWVYSVFAIRNSIAVAIQPLSAQPVAVGSTAAVAPEPRTAGVSPSRSHLRASFKASGPAKATTSSATRRSVPSAPATRDAAPANSARTTHHGTSESRATGKAKTGNRDTVSGR
jgi:hypothetical protein